MALSPAAVARLVPPVAERVKRPCIDCGVPAFGPRCPAHQLVQRAKYGAAHVATRNEWRPLVEAGQVFCWSCTEQIRPVDLWDLGHVTAELVHRFAARWPEHQHCNRSRAAGGDHAAVGA